MYCLRQCLIINTQPLPHPTASHRCDRPAAENGLAAGRRAVRDNQQQQSTVVDTSHVFLRLRRGRGRVRARLERGSSLSNGQSDEQNNQPIDLFRTQLSHTQSDGNNQTNQRSAGCVLANRLSVNPKIRVLLLEAGGDDRLIPFVHVPVVSKHSAVI